MSGRITPSAREQRHHLLFFSPGTESASFALRTRWCRQKRGTGREPRRNRQAVVVLRGPRQRIRLEQIIVSKLSVDEEATVK